MVRAEVRYDSESIRLGAVEKIRARMKILQILPWLGAAVIAFSIFSYIVERNLGDFFVTAAIGGLLLVSRRATLWMAVREAKRQIGGQHYAVWEFSEEGIGVKGSGFETKVCWDQVRSVCFFDRMLCFEFTILEKSYLPKDSFENASSLVELQKLLGEKGVSIKTG